MTKDTRSRNPYAIVNVSDEQRQQLIDVVRGCVQTNFPKYENFIVTDKHHVDERRWDRVKSKDNFNVYTEHSQEHQTRKGLLPKNAGQESEVEKEMLVMMSVGTFIGELEDLMFGILNTTRNAMRIKAAYVDDVNAGAVLCSVVEPSKTEPYRSLVVKWMAIDVSLKAGKSRDFVCIEATDVLLLDNGERIGYHVLHSIEFPQTRPLPNIIRGNISSVTFFRHIHSSIIDSFGSCIVDPGMKARRLLFIAAAANTLLTATNYVRCGQMKKLAWMLQRQHAGYKVHEERQQRKECVMCGKSRNVPGISRIRPRLNFIGQDGEVIERKITVCSQCMSKAINCSTQEAAQDQAMEYHDSYDSASTFSESTFSESSSSLYHK
ncbi:unnamed protein product [Peronospora effusa]|uniref:START domain-containing protein n=1 Tax=Peronospora effusa TaxID=542832 RepID=A0A3M6VV99_9STRA|nr:hypothetical protein DD238_000990 [Peronospora effusa]RQM12285.1 hypothetical protein DD237_005707 [Peronospora effusa]CAI5720213.1 unnamed protein product [Peronospora effusa]